MSTLKTRATRLATFNPNATEAEMANYHQVRAAFVADVEARWETDELHREIAALIDDQTLLRFNSEIDAIAAMVDFRKLDRTDKLTVSTVDGVKVHEVAPGGLIRQSQINVARYEVGRTQFGFRFRVDIDDVTDFAENLADLIALGGRRMGMTVQKYILAALRSASPVGAANYQNVAGLTEANLTAALNKASSKAAVSGANLTQLTIAGRSAMTQQIFAFNGGFDPTREEELRKTGRVGQFKGANVVQLLDWVDEDETPLVAANEVFIFAGNVGKFATLGVPTTKTWEENNYPIRNYRTLQRFTGIVNHPEAMVRVEDNTVSE